MPTQGLYPPLVDPRYQEYADAVDRAIIEDRLRRTPRVTEILQPPKENSALTDIGHGLARGVMVTAPEMVGQAAQAFGADQFGKEMADAARARGQDEAYRTTGALGEAASMLPTMLGIGATALIPGVGQVVAPAASAALFGGSQYTATREKGGSIPQALGTAAVQSVGQAIGGHIAGKLVSGAAGAMQGAALDRGFRAFADPSLYGTMARGLVRAEAAQLPTQAIAAGSVAGIESGLPDTPTAWEAAKHSFAPTALLTAALAPFGAPAIMRTNRSRAGLAAVLQDPNETPYKRAEAAQSIARELRVIDVEGATRWQIEALAAINAGAVPELRPDYKFDIAEPPPPPPDRFAPAGLGLPAPGDLVPPDVVTAGGPGGPQTPFDLSRQQAQQGAAERNDALWAARNAEEQRMAAHRAEHPTAAGIDVTELPTEHINVRGAELPTYDVKETSEASLYDASNKQDRVTWIKSILGGRANKTMGKMAELPADDLAAAVQKIWHKQGGEKASKAKYTTELEEIYKRLTGKDIREVTPDATQAAAEEGKGTESKPAADEAGAKAAADAEQGAKAAGDAEPRVGAGQAAPEGQVGEVVEVIDSANPRVMSELGGKLGRIIEIRGEGENKRYVIVNEHSKDGGLVVPANGVRLPATEEITLREIPEVGFGEWARTLEGQVGYGDISRTPPTLKEVADAQAITVPVPREAPFNEHPAEVAVRNYEVARAQREMAKEQQGIFEADQLKQKHREAIDQARQAENEAATNLAAATSELRQVESRLMQLDTHSQQLGQLREAYNEVVRGKKVMDPDLRQRLQKAIGDAAATERANAEERTTLEQRRDELSDVARSTPEYKAHRLAMERTSRVEQKVTVDPAADPAYYTFTRGLEPDIGAGRVTNLMRLFSYIEAHKYAGSLKDFLKQIPDGADPKNPNSLRKTITELSSYASKEGATVGVRRAAKGALESRDPAEHKQLVEHAIVLARAVDTVARINGPAKVEENKIQAALKEYYRMHAEFDLQNKKIEDMVKSGTMTQEEASVHLSSIEQGREMAGREFKSDEKLDDIVTKMFNILHNRFERNLETADREKTGYARLNNGTLGDVLFHRPYSANALDFIGRTNQNPLIRTVAKLLAKGNPTATIRVIENPDFNGGRYVPSTDTIEIGRGGMNTTTMLHEITHALAHAGITRAFMNRSMRRQDLTAQQQKEVDAFNTIEGIMMKFRAQLADPGNPEHMLALKDEHEFLSEALNNPEMQRLLGGRANLLTRMFDAVRDLVPAWKRARTDFEQLMQAAPTLFGNPNRNLSIIFRNPLNYTVRDPFTTGVNVLRTVSGFDWLNRKTQEHNLSSIGYEQMLRTSSLQQQRRFLTMLLDGAKKEFPQFEAVLDRFSTLHQKFRDHMADRAGVSQLVLVEGNDIAVRAHQMRARNRTAFDDMGAMGTQATIHRIDAAAKTLAEAQKRNPTLTPEEWNSATARGLRAEYQRLERVSAQMRSKYGKDAPTPISLYHEMVNYQDLLFSRGTAENMSLMLRTYGAHLVPDIAKRIMPQLDTKEQAGNGPRDVPAVIQQAALDRGMKQAMAAVKKIRDDELAAGGKTSKGALDADSLYRIMEESYAHYSEMRQVPYMHIGRPGNKMIMFTVAGGDAEWSEVSKLMNATREKGGLERGMGTPYKGNRRVYMKFDNDVMHNEADAKLAALLRRGVITDWASGPITEKLAGLDSAPTKFVQTLRDRINASEQFDNETKKEVVSQLFDTFLQQLPDNSPLKASASRDGFSGYSTDYIRSFSDRVTMSSQSISRLRSATRVAETMKEVEAAMRDLRTMPGGTALKSKIGLYMNDFRGRAEELNRPVSSPFVDRLRAFPAFWRLALSPAYVATIMYQPWQVTMPVLGGRYGYANTLASMSKNFGLSLAILNSMLKKGWLDNKDIDNFTKWANLSNLTLEFSKMKSSDGVTRLLTDHQLDLLNHVQWQGVLNFGQINQIARIDMAAKGATSKLLNISTIAPHYVEISNRLISALSAHELYMAQHAKGLTGDALAAVHKKAKDYAVQVIRDSDGDHSQANIARRLGRHGFLGPATPLVVGFQHFFIQMSEMMFHRLLQVRYGTMAEKKEAAKTLGGVYGMTALMSGVLGTPFMGLATSIGNRLISMFQDDNDDPPDLQLAIRKTISKAVGGGGAFGGAGTSTSWADKMEEVLSRGLPRLADVDMSTRSGLQDLAPFTPFLADRRKLEDSIKDHVFNLAGPAVGAIAGIATGTVQGAMQGDWPKFINDALPTFVRGYAKAYRQANYGYETEGGGNQIPIAAPSAWNLAAQSAGFTSGARAEQGEASFAYKTTQQLLERRQQEIRNRMYRAQEHGDYAELGRLMEEETKFLMRHPQFHLNLRQGLKQRAEARAVGEMTGTGILANKRALYPMMQQFQQQ